MQDMKPENKLPNYLAACIGGGSNAIRLFTAILEDKDVQVHRVESAGISFKDGDHAAPLTYGKPGVIHGFKCHLLKDDKGEPMEVYSVASGLDYPGVGPNTLILRAQYHYITTGKP